MQKIASGSSCPRGAERGRIGEEDDAVLEAGGISPSRPPPESPTSPSSHMKRLALEDGKGLTDRVKRYTRERLRLAEAEREAREADLLSRQDVCEREAIAAEIRVAREAGAGGQRVTKRHVRPIKKSDVRKLRHVRVKRAEMPMRRHARPI